METAFSLLIGLFFAVGVYLMLSRHTVRMVIGIAVFGNGVNLTIFTAGRILREAPPVIGLDAMTVTEPVANPLPQALILTAIVISFSFLAFLLVLIFRSYQALDTDDTESMRLAEPRGGTMPPLGY